jgi:PAS domain-containing protein
LLEGVSSSPNNWHIQITQVISVISVSILGMAIVAILNSQKSNQEDILKSRNRERNQREKLLTIINNLTDSMMVVNTAGKIEVYNAAALNLLDTNETLTGRNISKFLNLKDDTGEEFNILKTLKQTKQNLTRSDLVYETPTETIRIELTLLPIHGTYSDNTRNDYRADFVKKWRELFGNEHTKNTLVHIPVHALMQAIFEEYIGEPERIIRDKEMYKGYPDYEAAWDYVEKVGYKKIIEQLRSAKYEQPTEEQAI